MTENHIDRKIVVVGGVAGGMSFAARARRLCESCEIVVIERGPYVSFANCGLPYYLSGEIEDRDDLVLQTPESLRASLDLDVRVCSEVQHIDRQFKKVSVVDTSTGHVYDEGYDTLVISTGATAFDPPIVGLDSPRVHKLRTIPDVDALQDRLIELENTHARAVVIGAGFIGLEAVEALRHRGIDVSVVELSDQVLPPLDPEMARAVQLELERHDVDVRLGESVSSISDRGDGVDLVLSGGDVIEAGMALVAVGVRAESALACEAGLTIDDRGGVITDDNLLTSDENIYAVGDVIEVVDAVSGAPSLVPLAGPANRQGRAAANHLFGRSGVRSPVLGTAIVRVFDVVAATVGQSEKALSRANVPFHAIHLHPAHHAGYFPGAQEMHLKVLFDATGKILGAQAVGGEGVDKRIDVLATAMHAQMTMSDLADVELAYAPPFGSAKDPVNMAGFMGENILSGDLNTWSSSEFNNNPSAVLLDVRSKDEYDEGHLDSAVSIPHTELRRRVDEIPPDVPIHAYCASGFRSYLAVRFLQQAGWQDARSLDGGLKTLLAAEPQIELVSDIEELML